MNNEGFLKTIQKTHPDLWATIEQTAKSGLVIIDEENDSVTATNRLLFTYPGLHEALSTLINEWEENHLRKNKKNYFNEIVKNIEGAK